MNNHPFHTVLVAGLLTAAAAQAQRPPPDASRSYAAALGQLLGEWIWLI